MSLIKWSSVLVATAVFASAALAQTPTPTQALTYTVKRVAKEGAVHKFRMNASIEIMGQNATVSVLITEKVTKVEDNGDYTVESSQTEGKLSFNGMDQDLPESTPSTTKYDAKGGILDIQGEHTGDGSEYRLAHLNGIFPPDQPVKEGDEWTVKGDSDSKGSVAYEAHYKILGAEKVGDADTLKLDANVKETTGDAPASAVGNYWITPDTFELVKAEVTWTNAPIPGAPGPVNGKITITRES